MSMDHPISGDSRPQSSAKPVPGSADGGLPSAPSMQPIVLHVRCPHCHNPIAIVDTDPLADV